VVVAHDEQDEHDGTSFSTHFGTIRQHMTVSVTGTQTRTVRVQGTSTTFGTQVVTVYWHCSATQRVRVQGTVMVFWTILQVVTQ
jgi:hypothetical protein